MHLFLSKSFIIVLPLKCTKIGKGAHIPHSSMLLSHAFMALPCRSKRILLIGNNQSYFGKESRSQSRLALLMGLWFTLSSQTMHKGHLFSRGQTPSFELINHSCFSKTLLRKKIHIEKGNPASYASMGNFIEIFENRVKKERFL